MLWPVVPPQECLCESTRLQKLCGYRGEGWTGFTGFGVGSVAVGLGRVGLDIVRSPFLLCITVAPVSCSPAVWSCWSLLDWGASEPIVLSCSRLLPWGCAQSRSPLRILSCIPTLGHSFGDCRIRWEASGSIWMRWDGFACCSGIRHLFEILSHSFRNFLGYCGDSLACGSTPGLPLREYAT